MRKNKASYWATLSRPQALALEWHYGILITIIHVLLFSSIMETPHDCIDTAIYGFTDYFGFNATYVCHSIETEAHELAELWRSIYHPLCEGRPENAVSCFFLLSFHWSLLG